MRPWPKFLILNFALGGGYPYKINGIERPCLGLPSSTVEKIRQGSVAMQVDWVASTRAPHSGDHASTLKADGR